MITYEAAKQMLRMVPALMAAARLQRGERLTTEELEFVRDFYDPAELPEIVRADVQHHPNGAGPGRPRVRRGREDIERMLDIIVTFDDLMQEARALRKKAPRDHAVLRLKQLYKLPNAERVPTLISSWRKLRVVKMYLPDWIDTKKYRTPTSH